MVLTDGGETANGVDIVEHFCPHLDSSAQPRLALPLSPLDLKKARGSEKHQGFGEMQPRTRQEYIREKRARWGQKKNHQVSRVSRESRVVELTATGVGRLGRGKDDIGRRLVKAMVGCC